MIAGTTTHSSTEEQLHILSTPDSYLLHSSSLTLTAVATSSSSVDSSIANDVTHRMPNGLGRL